MAKTIKYTDSGELEKWMSEEEVHQLLEGTHESLRAASESLDAMRAQLALEIGRNEKWQSMFEDLVQASAVIAMWVKKVYLTKTIELAELEHVFMLADRIEKVSVSYRKRKDQVAGGAIAAERMVDND